MIRENLEEKREEDRRKESLIFFVKILLTCNFLYEVTTQFFQGGLNWTATKLERQMNPLNSEAYNKKPTLSNKQLGNQSQSRHN